MEAAAIKTVEKTTPVVEAAALEVSLADFIGLSTEQKISFLHALEGDPRFASILPQLKAVLAAETSGICECPGNPTPTKGVMGYLELATLIDDIHDAGRGDLEYWIKTVADNARAVHALSPFVSALAVREGGTLRPRLEGLASKLADVSSKGYGDIDYWIRRSSGIRRAADSVANQLRELAPVGKGSLPAKEALRLLADFARSTTSKGYGDIDYWMRSCTNAARIAKTAGRAVADVAGRLSEPDRTVVLNVARQLQEVSSQGRGNLDYWIERTSKAVRTIDRLANSLDEIVSAM